MRHRTTGLILVWVILAALSLSPAAAHAQLISGWVLRADRTPIPDATVLLRGEGGDVLARVTTRPDGRFEIHPGAAGRMHLEATHLGYASWETAPFDLAADADLEVLISLQIEPIPLDEVVVEARRRQTTRRLADFEHRKEIQAFGGYFIDEEDIARRPASRPSNLVLGAPGMTVRAAPTAGGGRFHDEYLILSHGCPVTVYVDGVRIDQMRVPVDEYLDMDRIAGIEVYPRAMSAPPQYQDARRRECGSVVYWTKDLETDDPGGWNMTKIVLGGAGVTALLLLGVLR
jgi:hypothetical protein